MTISKANVEGARTQRLRRPGPSQHDTLEGLQNEVEVLATQKAAAYTTYKRLQAAVWRAEQRLQAFKGQQGAVLLDQAPPELPDPLDPMRPLREIARVAEDVKAVTRTVIRLERLVEALLTLKAAGKAP